MSKANEPAFPHFTYDVVRTSKDRNGNDLIQPIYVAEGGLTKREYFAAMAMQGAMATWPTDPKSCAHLAVMHADALIAELEKN